MKEICRFSLICLIIINSFDGVFSILGSLFGIASKKCTHNGSLKSTQLLPMRCRQQKPITMYGDISFHGMWSGRKTRQLCGIANKKCAHGGCLKSTQLFTRAVQPCRYCSSTPNLPKDKSKERFQIRESVFVKSFASLHTQCDQIGRFLKVLGDKSSPNIN